MDQENQAASATQQNIRTLDPGVETPPLHHRQGYRKEQDDSSHTRGFIEPCIICLDPISDRAVAVPCNHLHFDFICLASWLQEQPTCPLCKVPVVRVEYEWHAPDDFKTYRPEAPRVSARLQAHRSSVRNRSHLPLRNRQTSLGYSGPSRDPAVDRRRQIYADRCYSSHIGTNDRSRYQNLTTQEFCASTDLQTRARVFLRRELQVFTFLDMNPLARNRDYLIEYIVLVLRTHEIKGADDRAQVLVQEFLGAENTEQLLHELKSWLRSPYNKLTDWDRETQYITAQRSCKRAP